MELVGRLTVHDAAPGIVSDVGVLESTAYLGQFVPGCLPDGGGGVYVIDVSDPANPSEIGFVPTPGAFVGEGVQATSVNTRRSGATCWW